jgi:hypothetical protein
MHSRFLKHKFKAKPVTIDNMRFASQLEGQFYSKLCLEKKAGNVLFFMQQVPFHLPGGIKYVCDFQVFYANGDIRFIDVKGMETKEFIMKKKMVEDLYPITIDIVKRGNFNRF